MKKSKIVIRIGLLVTVVSVLTLFISRVIKVGTEMQESQKNNLPRTFQLTQEDSGLIGQKYISEIKVDVVANSKIRPHITLAHFRKKYELVIYKLNVAGDIPIDQLIKYKTGATTITSGVTYSDIEHGRSFVLSFLDQPARSLSQLYLTLDGDSLVTLPKTDSLISYNLKARRFSMQDAPHEPVQVFFTGPEGPMAFIQEMSVSLTFLKRNKAVYMLLMVPESRKDRLAPDLLDCLVRNK